MPIQALPVSLPENINLNTKVNPLDHQKEWIEIEIEWSKMQKRNGYFGHICGFFLVFFKILFKQEH